MKILVIGGSSFIGSSFVKSYSRKNLDIKYSFFNNQPPYPNGFRLDIRDKKSISDFFVKNKFDLIIFSSAITNVDLCETDPDLAGSINVSGVENVVNICKNFNNKIIYISTSAVFDGNKLEYSETDKPKPKNVYGTTKLEGEKIIEESKMPYLILRTDQPYNWIEKWHHTNSVIRVIESLKKNKLFNEISDWYNKPTYVPDLITATNRLIENKLEGIFHISGSDFISRYEWALETARIFGLDDNLIQPINSISLNLPAKRANVNLSNEKLFIKTGIRMNGIKDGLNKMLKDVEK